MSQIKISALPEATELDNNEYAVVVQNGTTKKVKVNLLKSGEAGELTGDDGTKYKIAVKNGQLYLYSTEVDTSTPPKDGDNNLFDGLIINKMYGGGDEDNNGKTPVSHSFVELYNLKNTSVNLNGLYLWYKPLDGTWEKLKLRGIIPPHHSFLIRGIQHTEYHNDIVRCHVKDYDMEWNTYFSDQGFSMYLCIGSETPEENPVRYVKDNVTGSTTWTNGRYIDLLGCGGSNDQSVTAFETRFLKVMNSYTGVMREDFANSGKLNIGCNKSVKGNNEADCVPINFKECDVEIYGPRSLKYGEWNEFYNKPMLKKSYPNFITICYGEKGDSTRTFTWQTVKTNEGFLKYRKLGTSKWTKEETNKRLIRHKTEDATIHSVIIRNLTTGTYEYQCGEEGCWSDIETFEVKKYNESTPIKMLITSDEQGWTENEYAACKTAAKFIEKNEEFDFHLNCGDISQNANRYFEWLYYYNYYPSNRNVCHHITCGNNDLISKKYSDAFAYYSTHENQKWNSVHAWDLGFVHFVCLNSNTDYTYVNGDGSIGGFASTDDFLKEQCRWLDEHLTEVSQREEAKKPRWVVCYMHLSPFTVVRTERLQRFVSVFEKHKVPLVLCGHNHAYSRSKALYTGYDYDTHPEYNDYVTKEEGSSDLKIVDEVKKDGSPIKREEDRVNGTHYVLAQATSFKLSGKEKPIKLPAKLLNTIHDNGKGAPWWIVEHSTPPQPSYINVEFAWNHIKLDMYYIENILTKDDKGNITVHPYTTEGKNAQTRKKFDTLEILYSERNPINPNPEIEQEEDEESVGIPPGEQAENIEENAE